MTRTPPTQGAPPLRRPDGFSLIEVLAVMAVLALAGWAVVQAMPPEPPAFEREAARLTGKLAEAARTSIAQGAPVGVLIDQRGYDFRIARRGRWLPLTGSTPLGAGRWAEGVAVEVERLGLDVRLDTEEADAMPALIFEPFGSAEPTVLRLLGGTGTATIRIGADGSLRMDTTGDG